MSPNDWAAIVVSLVGGASILLSLMLWWIERERRLDREQALYTLCMYDDEVEGLPLIKRIEEMYGRDRRGVLYVTLNALENDGLLESRSHPNGSGGRLYRITEAGRRVVQP